MGSTSGRSEPEKKPHFTAKVAAKSHSLTSKELVEGVQISKCEQRLNRHVENVWNSSNCLHRLSQERRSETATYEDHDEIIFQMFSLNRACT